MPTPNPVSTPAPGTHPWGQWLKRGDPARTLSDALQTAVPVDICDDTVVDADAYYHTATDTLIVAEGEIVQTVLDRDGAPLRCPHDRDPDQCPTCSTPPPNTGADGDGTDGDAAPGS